MAIERVRHWVVATILYIRDELGFFRVFLILRCLLNHVGFTTLSTCLTSFPIHLYSPLIIFGSFLILYFNYLFSYLLRFVVLNFRILLGYSIIFFNSSFFFISIFDFLNLMISRQLILTIFLIVLLFILILLLLLTILLLKYFCNLLILLVLHHA